MVLVVQKFALLTGSTSPVVAHLPWLVAAVAVAGACWAACCVAARRSTRTLAR